VTLTWNVRVEAHTGSAFGWLTYVKRLSYDKALETARQLSATHPLWQMRLVDDNTGEITHLKDGKPVEAEGAKS
jgi:hypothetical protein